MTKTKAMLALLAAVALAMTGCGGDMAKQIVSNEQLRGQVLDAITHNRTLTLQTVDRLMATDTLRVAVVNHMLMNDNVAKQVIVRIATSPDAFDMVMSVAVHDTAMRAHVMTLVKGIQMAGAK